MTRAASSPEDLAGLGMEGFSRTGSAASGNSKLRPARKVICLSLWAGDVVDKGLVLFCVLLLLVTSIGILFVEPKHHEASARAAAAALNLKLPPNHRFELGP